MDAAALDLRYLNALRVHWKRNKAFPSMAKLADVIGLKSAAGVFAVMRIARGPRRRSRQLQKHAEVTH